MQKNRRIRYRIEISHGFIDDIVDAYHLHGAPPELAEQLEKLSRISGYEKRLNQRLIRHRRKHGY